MSDEYDAFGRKTEDSGLGWDTSATTTQPTPAPAETRPAQPVTGLVIRRRPVVLPWLLAIVVLGGIGLALFSVGKEAKHKIDTVTDLIPSTPGTDDGDDTVPTQVKVESFFTPKGLRAGLRILASEQPGRITNFSMRKDRIDLQVTRGGKSHVVELQAGAEAPQEFSSSTATTSGIDTFTYEELSPAAPDRLMRAANARLGQSPKSVDYFVAQKWTGSIQWGVYYKNSKIAQGDSRGRFTRRIS